MRRSQTAQWGEQGGPPLLEKIVSSSIFNIAMATAIGLNCIYVAVEQGVREEGDNSISWLLIEIIFNVIFLVEFLMKLADAKMKFFKDLSNNFDFFLVVLGFVGIVMNSMEQASKDTGSSEARLIRLSRVFRVLRFLRVFRLFHAKLSRDTEVSMQVAKRMKRISVLVSYAHAHLGAQTQLVKYFGANGKIDDDDEAEMARCILQSQLFVYRALKMAISEGRKMDKDLLNELKWCYVRKAITERLETFVMHAHEDCAISSQEAQSILHPMHHQINQCLKGIRNLREGILDSHEMLAPRYSTAATSSNPRVTKQASESSNNGVAHDLD
eukprot:gnl/TRDRNA2_/TRDRNA2_167705_c1_seq1.p1 gnl/TRDRNA2_/TRDRNA2_167705_c1~~gnl/TRDRNA2_/TRDRNA2_167705_c1_seq1.p1  ORF type:complete len:342 (+),score=65.05 gnl/TRDRNA2_/TRDRNA2_167705_c1_seq1:46-1026(+)